MALALSMSERCAADGEHREALRHYQRYHQLYVQRLERRLASQSALPDPALMDAATGLASGMALEQRLPGMLQRAQQQGTPASLCLVRMALDTLQPARGLPADLQASVMLELGALLRANSRSKDMAVSEGPGRLTLVLCDVELAMARTISERLRRAVQSHDWARLHGPLRASLSMGLTAARPGDDAAQFIARADSGLASARRDGGNCVRTGV